MNTTINISIPSSLTTLAKQQVKSGYYSSLSEVIRSALRNFLLTPQIPTFQMSAKAEKRALQAEKDYKAGKAILMKSVNDLDNL